MNPLCCRWKTPSSFPPVEHVEITSAIIKSLAICGTEFWALNGSYDVAKKNIIWYIWCNAMCLCGLRLKKNIIFHILYIIVAPLCSNFLKRVDFYKLIVLRSEACSDWPAIQCVVIGRIPQAWDGNVTPLAVLWCMSRRDETKTIKPIINEAFVASSGDIITDYNDLYCLLMHRVVLTGCESEAKLELLHFIETVFVQTAL